ncbi:MAG: phytoene/squalene synthase family protein [Gammaproteobacteria bacterium]|nr:phytoene/squalene synthase family protein [Gammaproteobacteria bacterium]
MTTDSVLVGEALGFQAAILERVSRTFAITIPQLPPPLCTVVTNAYLLCRIADTIEDEPQLDQAQKEMFSARLVALLAGEDAAQGFAEALVPLLSKHTLPAERELIAHVHKVLAVTHSLNETQQRALRRCVEVMSTGMSRFQRRANRAGLADHAELDRYCYYVAGVVGEMLTELFCAYSERIACHREQLMALAPSFGQGLQMTNILKDIHDDHHRGVCWLPRSAFDLPPGPLHDLVRQASPQAFGAGMESLLAVAHAHLRNARTYTLLLPREETGIRRFCLWALGLAVLTLKNIHRRPLFRDAREVKVSRRTVAAVAIIGRVTARHDSLIDLLFRLAARSLPEPAGRQPAAKGIS